VNLSRFSLLKTAFDPHFPFSPQRFPFFYGWIIAVFTTVGTLFSIPGQTAGVSVFTDPVIAATGLSRVQLSSAYLVGTLGSSFMLPLGGRLMDRFGARLTVMLSSLGLGLTLVYLSVCDYLIAFLNGFFPLVNRSMVGLVVMAIGFTALRFSGQGILTLVSRNTIAKWFDRRRGFVSGIANVFISFGFSAAPLILSFWIDGFGWRGAWLALAVTVGGGMTFLGWLFYRDNPEICGLTMDGKLPKTLQQETSEGASQTEETVENWGINGERSPENQRILGRYLGVVHSCAGGYRNYFQYCRFRGAVGIKRTASSGFISSHWHFIHDYRLFSRSHQRSYAPEMAGCYPAVATVCRVCGNGELSVTPLAIIGNYRIGNKRWVFRHPDHCRLTPFVWSHLSRRDRGNADDKHGRRKRDRTVSVSPI